MSSSTEDDTELRELVTKVLDSQGILGKIKAQLRSQVYMALEQGEKMSSNSATTPSSSLVNPMLREFLSTTSGRLVASLVREFLEFFGLDFTLAVFDPETNVGKDFRYRGREKLVEALGLTELVDTKLPLISEIMRLSKVSVLKSESPTPTEVSLEDENTSLQHSLAEDDPPMSHQPLTVYKECKKVEDVSDNSASSTTPEIALDMGNLSLTRKPSEQPVSLGKANKDQQSNKGNTELQDKSKTRELNSTFTPDSSPAGNKSRESSSLLSDLPPLGGGSLSTLGDLPPLTSPNRPLGLAPLKKIPSLNSKPDEKSKPAAAEKPAAAQPSLAKQPAKKSGPPSKSPPTGSGGGGGGGPDKPGPITAAPAAKKGEVPSLGFSRDHVIAEEGGTTGGGGAGAGDGKRKGEEERGEQAEDLSVSEEIEEDLDSFLNSSQSGGDDLTKDEPLPASDTSLRADYLESL